MEPQRLLDGVKGPQRGSRAGVEWVLSLPYRLRYQLAWDHELCRGVVGVFVRAVLGFLRAPARGGCHARSNGFDLRAGLVVPAAQRERCERVCRCALRPPVTEERLSTTFEGQVQLQRRLPWAGWDDAPGVRPLFLSDGPHVGVPEVCPVARSHAPNEALRA